MDKDGLYGEGATPYQASFLGGVSAQQTYDPLLCVRVRVWRPNSLGHVRARVSHGPVGACVASPVPTIGIKARLDRCLSMCEGGLLGIVPH